MYDGLVLTCVAIIQSTGISIDQFYEAIKEVRIIIGNKYTHVQRSKTDEEVQWFINILLSLSEYENFVELMRTYKKEHKQ